jgi:hypothetical protein
MREILRAKLEILEWAIRLTYSGMPVSMLRYWLLKKHQEVEEMLSDKRNGSDFQSGNQDHNSSSG